MPHDDRDELDALERLAALRAQGAVSQQEYDRLKAQVLAGDAPASASASSSYFPPPAGTVLPAPVVAHNSQRAVGATAVSRALPNRSQRVLIGVAVLTLAVAGFRIVGAGSSSGAESMSAGPKSLNELMTECISTGNQQAGQAPPSAEELAANGRGASTQFDALIAGLDQASNARALTGTCVQQKGPYACKADLSELAGCWPTATPDRVVYFNPEKARLAKSGF